MSCRSSKQSHVENRWRHEPCPKSSVCGQAKGTISCAALSSTWQMRFAGVIGQAGECQTEQGPLSASSGQCGSLSCGLSLGKKSKRLQVAYAQADFGQRCPAAHVRVGRYTARW